MCSTEVLAPIGELLGLAERLAAVDPTTQDELTQGAEILGLDRAIRMLQSAQAQRVRTFDTRDAAVADGMPRASTWLTSKDPTVSFGEAKSLVALGRSLVRLPALAAAFAEGAVSATHVRILARYTREVDPAVLADAEPMLTAAARRTNPPIFSHLVRDWVARVDRDAAEKDAARTYDARRLSHDQTFENVWHTNGLFDPEGGLRVHKVLESLSQRSGPDDPRTKQQRNADAMVAMADIALAHGDLPTTAGQRPEIVVHATAETMAGDSDAPAHLDGAGPLTRGALERMQCDARWRRLLFDALRVPFDYGRDRRDWPPSLRKFIVLRDRGCRHPGCPMPASACEIHHIRWWEHGGQTCADNGLLLCRYHHHCIHDRGHRVKLLPDTSVEWTLPDGRTLTGQPRGPTDAMLL